MQNNIFYSYIFIILTFVISIIFGLGIIFPNYVDEDEYTVVDSPLYENTKYLVEGDKFHKGLLKDTETHSLEYEIDSWGNTTTIDGISITYEYTAQYSVNRSDVEEFHHNYNGVEWKISEDVQGCVSESIEQRFSNKTIINVLENEWVYESEIECDNIESVEITKTTANEEIWDPDRIHGI